MLIYNANKQIRLADVIIIIIVSLPVKKKDICRARARLPCQSAGKEVFVMIDLIMPPVHQPC